MIRMFFIAMPSSPVIYNVRLKIIILARNKNGYLNDSRLFEIRTRERGRERATERVIHVAVSGGLLSNAELSFA